MMIPISRILRTATALAVLTCVLAACGTKPAPNFRGRWHPVNSFAEQPQQIPLHTAYVYAPAPLDHTLKTMLTRWARDSKMTLSYLAPADYTLHQPVTGISTTSVQQAVSQLSSAYAAQGISVTYANNQIVVRANAPAQP